MKMKLNLSYNRIVCEEMIAWIEEHKDRVFTVEKSDRDAIKLFGVGFWITKDLLLPL
jgi:hypothetical protein